MATVEHPLPAVDDIPRPPHLLRDPVEELADATWNYRVMLTDAGEYEVREVYYNTAGEVIGWVGHPAGAIGIDPLDLRREHMRIGSAFTRPLLVETTLPGYEPDSDDR